MKLNDVQLGRPNTLYKDTKANLTALTGVVQGSIAYATDTSEIGVYDGAAWDWVSVEAIAAADVTYDPSSTYFMPPAVNDVQEAFEEASLSWVENGNSHDHDGAGVGGGGTVPHTALSDLNGDSSHRHLTDAEYTDLTDGGVTALHSHAAAGTSIAGICNGRLTLVSGAAIGNDVTGGTKVYWTPYKGNQIALYNGTTWDVISQATDPNYDLAGKTASTLYDIFGYNNSGALALEGTAWTNVTTRATALTLQDGVYVKTGDPTRRYLGTIYVNSSGGQTDDSVTKRNVWNYYNRVPRKLFVAERTGHTYNGVVRLWNNSETNNRLAFVIGVAEDAQTYTFRPAIKAGVDAYYATVTIYMDGAELNTIYQMQNFNSLDLCAGVTAVDVPAAGYHYLNLYEAGNNANSTFTNMFLAAAVRG